MGYVKYRRIMPLEHAYDEEKAPIVPAKFFTCSNCNKVFKPNSHYQIRCSEKCDKEMEMKIEFESDGRRKRGRAASRAYK